MLTKPFYQIEAAFTFCHVNGMFCPSGVSGLRDSRSTLYISSKWSLRSPGLPLYTVSPMAVEDLHYTKRCRVMQSPGSRRLCYDVDVSQDMQMDTPVSWISQVSGCY